MRRRRLFGCARETKGSRGRCVQEGAAFAAHVFWKGRVRPSDWVRRRLAWLGLARSDERRESLRRRNTGNFSRWMSSMKIGPRVRLVLHVILVLFPARQELATRRLPSHPVSPIGKHKKTNLFMSSCDNPRSGYHAATRAPTRRRARAERCSIRSEGLARRTCGVSSVENRNSSRGEVTVGRPRQGFASVVFFACCRATARWSPSDAGSPFRRRTGLAAQRTPRQSAHLLPARAPARRPVRGERLRRRGKSTMSSLARRL